MVEVRHCLDILEARSEKIVYVLQKAVETLSIENIPGGYWRPCGLTLMKTTFNGYKGLFVLDVKKNSRASLTNLKVTDIF